jgi:heme A synthase
MNEEQQARPWFRLVHRRLAPIAILLAAIWAILEFRRGRPVDGIYVLALGGFILFSYLRLRGHAAGETQRISTVPVGLQFYGFYGFFGACVVVGMAVFVLAVLDVTHAGILIGVVGLIGAAVSGYTMIRGTQNVRRWREEAGTETNSASETEPGS